MSGSARQVFPAASTALLPPPFSGDGALLPLRISINFLPDVIGRVITLGSIPAIKHWVWPSRSMGTHLIHLPLMNATQSQFTAIWPTGLEPPLAPLIARHPVSIIRHTKSSANHQGEYPRRTGFYSPQQPSYLALVNSHRPP